LGGNGKTGTDGDFFVTVDQRNWKRLKEEEEKVLLLNFRGCPNTFVFCVLCKFMKLTQNDFLKNVTKLFYVIKIKVPFTSAISIVVT
jgi:hypothetical protein